MKHWQAFTAAFGLLAASCQVVTPQKAPIPLPDPSFEKAGPARVDAYTKAGFTAQACGCIVSAQIALYI
ncbi:MAG: hypothetical protein A3K19_24730 [Lentisphaerae bacterium RIFOXYB12_FULL_65_16]|nr:MAG: hypothetical protein A3K18_24145 [Lentisphaerae bacterium RIFOXYA12_64_32]OGV90677.1 MAG: hypothetical protein A3K19_24730 [Lentisphaerae bacterium RIFOXYB12_FULL_65_16]